MKLIAILFILTAFSLAKILVLSETQETAVIIFPTLEQPNIDFIDLEGGCGSFTDCLEYIGAVLFNIGAGFIYIVLFIINLIVYLFDFFAIILDLQFTGIDGAPFWLNILFQLPMIAAVAIIIYKLLRRGSSNAA